MARFPEIDIPGSAEVAASLAALDLGAMHVGAEQMSDLYSVGHAVIRAALAPHAIDSHVEAAILTGVSSYEVLGSIVQSGDDLKRYVRGDVLLVAQGSEGVLDTIGAFDDAYADLSAVPELAEAVRLLSAREPSVAASVELLDHSMRGAAMLRTLQLEVDSLLAFPASLDQADF